jgi:hypothetical protein
LARTNFSFQKRQKELARKKKKDEKRKRKLEKKVEDSVENPGAPQVPTEDVTITEPE